MTVAALYIDRNGPYPGLIGPELCWDAARDARTYPGPHPAVLHPPCAAWCQLAGVREARYGYPRGEDGGLFRHAVDTLLTWGGVLEHPAYSKAWAAHGLREPVCRRPWSVASNGDHVRPPDGRRWEFVGWNCCMCPEEHKHPSHVGDMGLWVCQVSQCAYGTRMRKRTWLAYFGRTRPFELDWSEPYVEGTAVISGSDNHYRVERPAARVWTTEAKRTPHRFACTLVALAEHSREVPC